MSLLTLYRDEYGEQGTQGMVTIPAGPALWTMEPPWRANAVGISCIPEGVYRLRMRRSGVVERTTDRRFLRGWEIADVPGRTYIMFHPGNTMDASDGCVLVGLRRGVLGGLPAVLDSQDAFTTFMRALDPRESYDIDIRSGNPPEWP